MSKGLEALRHIVVIMMENRSFDHMLGDLKKEDPRINGLTGKETNPVRVQTVKLAELGRDYRWFGTKLPDVALSKDEIAKVVEE